MSNALVLFMKAPRPGTVKTRLTPRVTTGEAAELYRAFILDTLHLAQRVSGASLFVAWTPDDGLAELRSALDGPGDQGDPDGPGSPGSPGGPDDTGGPGGPGSPGGPDVNWFLQQGGHLGERLSNAFKLLLRKEWDKTVVLGGDSPLLPHAFVEEAFDALDRHDVVLGPAADGGYYLIGLSGTGRTGETGGRGSGEKAVGRYAGLFESIDWGTDRVLRQTRMAIRGGGLSCHELPVWHDVDRPGDLDRIAREIQSLRASGDQVTGRHTEYALDAVTRGRNPA